MASKIDHNFVVLDYADLTSDPETMSKKLQPLFAKAFGGFDYTSHPPPLGIVAIRNVPNFVETKTYFLPMGYKLATLSQSYLDSEMTDSKSMYNAGWSHGKEKLGTKPDYAKGSFYFNPITDAPGTQLEREKYPASYPCNIWPTEKLPQLKEAGKQMGRLMKDVVTLLAKHIDVFVQKQCPGYPVGLMGSEMENTEKVKGRLLYYFPLDYSTEHGEEEQTNGKGIKTSDNFNDSWIGWHNDSGFFTALAGDMFLDHETGIPLPKNDIDPNAGLYIMDRGGGKIKVDIPDDCMAVQMGECLQIITGGKVIATPHCVRSANPSSMGKERKVARISFPCFIDTIPSFPLKVPSGCIREHVLESAVVGCAKVPPLGKRYVWLYFLAISNFILITAR